LSVDTLPNSPGAPSVSQPSPRHPIGGHSENAQSLPADDASRAERAHRTVDGAEPGLGQEGPADQGQHLAPAIETFRNQHTLPGRVGGGGQRPDGVLDLGTLTVLAAVWSVPVAGAHQARKVRVAIFSPAWFKAVGIDSTAYPAALI
ncbi:hypothetical protein, partial [Streptomyces sp. NRRL F-2664]|uniref:hypothetical protein n=1 Tax=Streptomyces sp. NRRL F-2664 TaxID=1463842 RepID=UPI001F438BC5